MRISEIMFGDWVKKIDDPIPYRVDNVMFFNVARKLLPIPITPEILKKNGFSDEKSPKENYENGFVDWYCGNIKNVIIVQKIETETYDLYSGQSEIRGIRFVHELQNALRVCGHDFYADIFQI